MLLSATLFCVQFALAAPEQPALASRSAILLDAATGDVLFEKNADSPIPPASLTKLMTMHITMEDVEKGKLSLDDEVTIPRAAWAVNQPWGSSLMFLGPGQTVTLRELMLGLAVDSGNDAAVAVATRIGGDVQSFVKRMNEEAQDLGLRNTRFVEPSGYSEKNMTTAREFAAFCRAYLQRHPTVLADFHSVRDFSYPKSENMVEAFKAKPGTIHQTNRNLLLGELEGVDGLKTGYIVESGYNIALTGEREGTRLLAVLLGGPGTSSARGGRIRADDGGRLLSWGFDNFKTIRAAIERLKPQRVWKGAKGSAELETALPLVFTIGKDRGRTITYEVVRKTGVSAPIAKGTQLGEIVFSDEAGILKKIPLVAKEDIARASPIIRATDSIAMFILRSFGRLE